MQVSNGVGTWGYSGYPTLYDWFAANGAPHYLMDTSLFPDPSAALAAELQSGRTSGGYGLQTYGANGAPPKLYAPAVWRQGSSYSHLDESVGPGGEPEFVDDVCAGVRREHPQSRPDRDRHSS